jgi:hypothetical protein
MSRDSVITSRGEWTSPAAGRRRAILHRVRTIAVVGASANPARASNFVLTYLLSSSTDHEVWPVTPNEDEVLGARAYPPSPRFPLRPTLSTCSGVRTSFPKPPSRQRQPGLACCGCSWGCTAMRRCALPTRPDLSGHQSLPEDRARPLPRRPTPRRLRHRRDLVQAYALIGLPPLPGLGQAGRVIWRSAVRSGIRGHRSLAMRWRGTRSRQPRLSPA